MSQYENPLEIEFGNKYFDGNSITSDNIKKYYDKFREDQFKKKVEWSS